MKVNEVLSCSFPSWFKKFKRITVDSIILTLPDEVLSYLQDDGPLVLPDDQNISQEVQNDWSEDDEDEILAAPNLTEFSASVAQAIKQLGGSVFPKLNWSSPKDASWIAFNKCLRCYNPQDVYLLLKSSDFVVHDLVTPFEDCSDRELAEEVKYNLILRKWEEINPSDEFRCFVKHKKLVGVSQRDTSQFYAAVKKEKDQIVSDVVNFWEENICNIFPLESYVFDVHRSAPGNVTLIDFNPFGPTTDGLMFSWQELLQDESEEEEEEEEQQSKILLERLHIRDEVLTESEMDSNRLTEKDFVCTGDVEFRFITNETGVQPSPYTMYGLPVDIINLSARPDPEAVVDFLQMKMKIEVGDSTSDDATQIDNQETNGRENL